ncbi:MAG: siroheme synthase [Deltaproteobacteria bacterium HGW-Deltaproteobacteria-15]|jgi:precorrin-2 dehydrogenase/sirohydrochlorin ferrochelatase|nr:MAG: siroheme synthase [Deltaproteobacteria bacterium HGW-Deltaproteobacteria-15]
MRYYPAFLDLHGKKVLIVGGGAVAQRKIETLFEYGAIIDVAARDLTPALKEFETEGRIRFVGSEFREDQMDRAFLVIAATDDPEMNRKVSLAAGERNIPVNAVDQPSDCTFIVPSILRRGDLVIAISTSGKSPALARRLREQLEGMYGEEYGAYVRLMGKAREIVLSGGFPPERKGDILRELIDSDLLGAIRLGDRSRVASTLERILRTELNEEIRELIQNM